MFKMISVFFSVISVMGFLLSMKFMTKMGIPNQAQILQQFSDAATKQDDVLKQITGQKTAVPNQKPMDANFNIAALLSGGTPAMALSPVTSTTPTEVEKPDGPMTVIRYLSEEENRSESGGTEVFELPPGAQVTFVDGRMQVFYPTGKPRQSHSASK
jgi:hypothetical protein